MSNDSYATRVSNILGTAGQGQHLNGAGPDGRIEQQVPGPHQQPAQVGDHFVRGPSRTPAEKQGQTQTDALELAAVDGENGGVVGVGEVARAGTASFGPL
jgi:hypothetical protein